MRIDDGDDDQVPHPPRVCPVCKARHEPGTPHQTTLPEDPE